MWCVYVCNPSRGSLSFDSDAHAYAMRLVNMQWFDKALYLTRSAAVVTMLLGKGADINRVDEVCLVGWVLCVWVHGGGGGRIRV